MFEIWYRTGGFSTPIESVEIIRATPKFVVYSDEYGRQTRSKKRSEWINWFETFDEARDFLVGRHRRKAATLRQYADHHTNRADEIELLSERNCPRMQRRNPR